MKTCGKCKEQKEAAAFNKCADNKTGLSHWCKACCRVYNRTRYQKVGDQLRAGVKLRMDGITSMIREKKDVPCADCGRRFHFCAMDFDHIDGEEKLFSVGHRRGTMAVMLAEIAKCEVVCANCHRIRTWKRRCDIPF